MEEPDGLDENMHSSSQLAYVDLSCTEASEVDILDVSIQNIVNPCVDMNYSN